mgnify:CR=1 FL=1
MNMQLVQEITKKQLRNDIPDFKPGDTLKVYVKFQEGDKTRTQLFEGVRIARNGGGIYEIFTVRKISYQVGVERVFPLHSPIIDRIEVAKIGKVRRAKLHYLRGLSGKAARIKEIMDNLRKDAPTEIGGVKVVAVEDYQTSVRTENGNETTIDLPKSNVLKYYLEDGSWIAARPSGTEPKCKFYFSIKGSDAKDASAKTEVFQKDMMNIIGE